MKKTIGKILKSLRSARGWNQEDIALELDISLSAYSKIERDVTDINFSRLEQIAKVYKMKAAELLNYGNENSSDIVSLKKLLEAKDKEIMQLQKELISLMKKNKL